MILHAKRAVRRHVSNARCGFQLSAGVVRKRGRRADSRKIVRAALINWAARLEFTPGANAPRSTEVGTITRPPADSPPHDAGSPSRRVGNSCRSSSRQSEGTRHTPTRSSTDGAAVAASANEARTYGRSASNRISARIICKATAIKPAGVVACICPGAARLSLLVNRCTSFKQPLHFVEQSLHVSFTHGTGRLSAPPDRGDSRRHSKGSANHGPEVSPQPMIAAR